MSDSIGQIIKRLRKERNFTQEELAEQLGVTAQAVSKWENETGMPDISQVIPLASVFGVSTDVLFGISGMDEKEEALKILQNAFAVQEYGKSDTYFLAYDMLIEGLKKYPVNLILLGACMRLGLSLSLPENCDLYEPMRASVISAETIRQAKLIISYSKDMSDIMEAHQVLVMLYSCEGEYEKAIAEARCFPVRTDFTQYSNMARINEQRGDYTHAVACLCSELDYSLQALEDNAVRLGKVYYSSGKYRDAISVYETFLAIIKVIFGDDCPPSYHDFDSGDCYILLAKAYLAVGETEQAMKHLESSITYYLNLIESTKGNVVERHMLMTPPMLRETALNFCIPKSLIKEKLLKKLSTPEIKSLSGNKRYRELYEQVIALKV